MAIAWVEPYYDGEHLRRTVVWLLRLDPTAPEPLLVAALTHDMERHFPGGTQPNKAAGAWDDVEYNTKHARRSAEIVSEWLRVQGVPDLFAEQVTPPILEHEFGGSPSGNVVQAADSLSFLDTNGKLVAKWILNGETTLEHGKRKLEWMYERIRVPNARHFARPLYEAALISVANQVGQAPAGKQTVRP
ncbi:MAG: DUF4202 domain-containing protein [Solirubrobacteraceae bacterium]